MHPERFNEIEEKVQEHDGKLKVLETRVTSLENVTLRLENTLMREGQETRKILGQVITHTQNMEKIKMNMWLKMVGTGGIVYLIIQEIFRYLNH